MRNDDVNFCLGSQDYILNMDKHDIKNGTFYLTRDTHKLFYADKKSIIPINESLSIVTELTDALIDTEKIYYVKESNLLCIYKDDEWTQINLDHYFTPEEVSLEYIEDTNDISIAMNYKNQDEEDIQHNLVLETIEGISSSFEDNKLILSGTKNADLSATLDEQDKIVTIELKDNNDEVVSLQIKQGNNIEIKKNETTGLIELNAKSIGINSVKGGIGKNNEGFSISVTNDINKQGYTGYINPILKLNNQEIPFINGIAELVIPTTNISIDYVPKGEDTEIGDIIMLDINSEEEKYVKAIKDGGPIIGIHVPISEVRQGVIPIGLTGRMMVKVLDSPTKGAYVGPSETPGVGQVYLNKYNAIGICVDDKKIDGKVKIRSL